MSDRNAQITRYAAAVLYFNGQVLLGRRTATRKNYPGIWDFVGGHCESGEGYEEALQRELIEEVNVNPKTFELIMTVDESPDFILKLFLVTSWVGEVVNRDPLEHDEVKWLNITDAKKLSFMNGNYLRALNIIEERQSI